MKIQQFTAIYFNKK